MLIGGDASGLRKATKNATKSLDKFSKSSANAAKKVGAAFGKMTAGITVAAVGLGAKAVDLASDFDESMSKTKAIFRDGADSIIASSKEAATAVGLSRAEFLDAASSFGVFGTAAGLSGDELATFSADLVRTSADVASFNNLKPEEALAKLRAGLSGETEPLKQLGILFNAAAVDAKALEMGLADVNGEISEGSKIMARNALIMEQLGAQGSLGDFEKTSGGLANQQRILTARLKDVGITIGTALLPIAAKLAEGVSNLIALGERWAPQMEQLRDRVKELGEQWMPKLKAAFDKVREAVEPIVRKIVDFIRTNPKPFIMGLAAAIGVVLVGAIGAAVVALGGIIFSVGGLIALFGAAVAAIAYFWQESETFRYVVTRVFEDVKAVVTPIINGIIETVQHLVDAFAGLITFLRGVFTGDFGMVMDGIKALFTGFYDAITSILETIQNAFVAFFSLDAVQTAIKYSLDKIMDFIRAIPDRVGKLAVGAFDALKTAFRSVLNWIIDKWNSIDFGFNIEIPSWVPGIGGKGFGIEDVIPDIPNIGGPTLLAPSAMLPSTALREATTTPTVINNINVTAPNVDPDSLISGLRRYNRSSGDAPVNIGFY
jgi:ElaB/YqjD/DUF883 family membrane-anchored ribosome-binding protein